jgi:cobalamin-dependent methionine synthase I
MEMLSEMLPDAKSIVGLSNVSNGVPNNLRAYLNRTYMMMLMKNNIYSVIMNGFDEELIKIARGKRPEHVKLVHDIMDGNMSDPAFLGNTELEYYKTAMVLTGRVLYSDSWLSA